MQRQKRAVHLATDPPAWEEEKQKLNEGSHSQPMGVKENETRSEKMKNGIRTKKKKRIAIVDDEPDLRNILSLVVRKAGHDVVVSAASGQSIVDYLFIQNPDCEIDTILMDYSMPGMNGMEASE